MVDHYQRWLITINFISRGAQSNTESRVLSRTVGLERNEQVQFSDHAKRIQEMLEIFQILSLINKTK